MGNRFWEIDFLRGTAIIMMILYHILFDLDFFDVFAINVYTGFWRYFAIITASIFIFVSGISLAISFYSRKKTLRKHIFRGARIFMLGLLITVVTFLYLGRGFVIFGILHFIGFSAILGYFFVRYKNLNLLLGISVIISGLLLQTMTFDFSWLLWLGFIPNGFYTIDYFPVFPWFGVFLIGIFFGNTFYPKGKRDFRIPEAGKNYLVKKMCFLGKHSLIIYLTHQVIIVMIISAIKNLV